jgi:hypothetical protein
VTLQNVQIVKEPAPSTDWRVYGDITDDEGNPLGDFGVDGTSVNQWWVMQDEVFQGNIVSMFQVIMAQQIVSGEAE